MTEILECDDVDPSITVAKIICMDLGWHLEYRQFDNFSGNFLLVIPALRFGQEMLLPSVNSSKIEEKSNLKMVQSDNR